MGQGFNIQTCLTTATHSVLIPQTGEAKQIAGSWKLFRQGGMVGMKGWTRAKSGKGLLKKYPKHSNVVNESQCSKTERKGGGHRGFGASVNCWRVKMKSTELLTTPKPQNLSGRRRASFWRPLDILQLYQLREWPKALWFEHLRFVKTSLGEICDSQMWNAWTTSKKGGRAKSLQQQQVPIGALPACSEF